MEPKAAELLAVLKNNNLSIDVKVGHLLGIKSEIKQRNVPDAAVPTIFESLRLSIASHHSALFAAGFSTLGHFLKRLFIQEQHHIVSSHARHICPVLLERLGDHKERVRAQAAQAFTDLWPAAGLEVEHYVLEVALTGKNPKSKEMSLLWLSNVNPFILLLLQPFTNERLQMSKNHGLLFRSYVPSLVACLEDADSVVRDTAKSTTVELFQYDHKG
jgi:CLIP-associating protein 1/2